MASQDALLQMIKKILKETEKAAKGAVSFALESSHLKEFPNQQACMAEIRVTLRQTKESPEKSSRIRWILPKENVFKDVRNQEWGLPWSVFPSKKEKWDSQEAPNIDKDKAQEVPSWYPLAVKFLVDFAKQKDPLQRGEEHRLEGRLNALWAGPFGEIGKILRADRLAEKANPLKKLEAARRVELEASSKGDGRIRRPHTSHKERLCPFHTPESKRIGLQLYRSASRDFQGKPLDTIPEELGSLVSLGVGMIPYLQHSDGPRLLMGGKNMKQAETDLAGSEPALVPGELEASRAFRELVGKNHVQENRLYPFLGVNALVAVMPYKGYTYEDGLVISRDFAEKISLLECKETQRIFVSLFLKKENEPVQLRETWQKELQERVGDVCHFGDFLPMPQCEEFCDKEKGLPSPVYEEREPGTLSEVTLRFLQKRPQGKSQKYNHEYRVPLDMEITWHFAISRPVRVGDKLTGRHGNKGVVTKILDTPPVVRLGKKEFSVDLCISPCSVLGRKNFGQIAEMVHSLALRLEEEELFSPKIAVEDLQLMDGREGRQSWRDLIPEFEEAEIFQHGTAPVMIPGDHHEYRAFVGYQYFCRLNHHAQVKLQARGTRGPVNIMTGQPSSGIPRGGQRLGEMENWAFLSHGVHQDFDGEQALDLLNRLREIPSGPKKALDLLEDIFYALGYEKDKDAELFSGIQGWKPLERSHTSTFKLDFWKKVLHDSREEVPSRGFLPLGKDLEEEKKVFQALGACLSRAAAQEEVEPGTARKLREFLGEVSPEEEDLLDPLRQALQKVPEKMTKNKGFFFSTKGLFLLQPRGIPMVPSLFTLREDDTRPLKRQDYVELLSLAELLSELPRLEDDPLKQDQKCKEILKKLRLYRNKLEKLVEGKRGYLRRHCMGRRCNFSGRAVIVPDPSLALDEVRLPVVMFLEMMDGHSITKKRGLEHRLQNLLLRAWQEKNLGTVVQESTLLFEKALPWGVLIRQPSLHRHSVQSFKVTLWEHSVIGLPPFITSGFNADFDGDTMAVYIPHERDQEEAAFMNLCKSPGKTGDGSLQIASDKDLALGWCALSPEKRQVWLELLGQADTPQPFSEGWITLKEYLDSLLAARGEAAFEDMARLQRELCDASTGVATVSPEELHTLYGDLEDFRKKSWELVEGTEAKESLEDELEKIEKESEKHIHAWLQKHSETSLARLVLGKARGECKDLRQTVVFLGYQNRFAEDEGTKKAPIPCKDAWIQGSFWGGLLPKELFKYSYASRESMASKKLAVAPAGHLTWKLAEGLYDVRVEEGDCGTSLGLRVQKDPSRDVLRLTAFGETVLEDPLVFPGKWDEALDNFAWGRVPLGMTRPLSKKDLKNIKDYWQQSFSSSLAEDLRDHLENWGGGLCLRSPLTCAYASKEKVCPLCCGTDIAKMPLDSAERSQVLELLPSGTAVGLTAAEAIGERGTQLAMKRFHQVGTSGGGREKIDRLQKLDHLLVRENKEALSQLERFQEILKILGEPEKKQEDGLEKIKRYKELPQQMIHFEIALISEKGLEDLAMQQGFPLRVARDVRALWKPFVEEEKPGSHNAEGLKERIFALGKERAVKEGTRS